MAVALATWSVQDPSLSHATDAPVRNLLGVPGAIGSDLLMQLLGLASTVLILPVAVWGWRIATHRSFDREWLRLLFWLGGTLLASAFVSCLPKSAKWPLPTGLGGVIGDAMLVVPSVVLGPMTGTTSLVVATFLGALALFAVVVAAGFGWRDPDAEIDDERPRRKARAEDDEERASISLGWLVHSFMSLKTRVLRLFGAGKAKPKKRRAPTPKISARDRIDPSFEAASSQEEEAEEDEEEEEDDSKFRSSVRPRKPPQGRRLRHGPTRAATSFPRSDCSPCRKQTSASRRARNRSRKPRPRWKAYCRTSACAARSSTRVRVRSSRSTNSSPRRASSPRA
jgi:S-DNA-T family DNA segregation ATPase FtsK/SpoIIIE